MDAAQLSELANSDSAYVGIVEESGSLFAMSPDRYPLVVFDAPNVGWIWIVYLVTTPKRFPPPRSAQKRSGCEVRFALSRVPFAVTTSKLTTLSDAKPCRSRLGGLMMEEVRGGENLRILM